MAAAITYADTEEKCDFIILLTDLYTPWPQKPPRKPLIVVAISNEHDKGAPEWLRIRSRRAEAKES